jgi:hypothetical protein
MQFNLEEDKLLLLLILTDLVFIILHTIHIYTSLLPSSLYSLSLDRGYAEFFQYSKFLWIFILFLIMGIKRRQLIFVIYSVLFLYFLFDDSFEFHERAGSLLAELFGFQPMLGLRAVDSGELAITFFFGTLFFFAIAITHLGSDVSTKKISKSIIIMVIILVLFGVGMDMIEIVVEHPFINSLLVILEEGGEMLMASIITWFAFRQKFHENNSTYLG